MSDYFDIQVNGFAGVDFQKMDLSKSELSRAVQALRDASTPKFFLTLITDRVDRLRAKLDALEQMRSEDALLAESIAGYHIEGPWISPMDGFRGAHDPASVSEPAPGEVAALQKAARGHIRMLTLAPEIPGTMAAIREARDQGIHVALGHTDAGMSEIEAAIHAGAEFVTHLGNGVPGVLHRHDNVIQRLLSFEELTAFLIPDGIHLPPFVLKNFFRAKTFGKALFTTDCMAAAGAPPGIFEIAGIQVEVGEDRVVRDPRTGLFAGSSLTMPEAMANVQSWLGLSVTEAAELCGQRIRQALAI